MGFITEIYYYKKYVADSVAEFFAPIWRETLIRIAGKERAEKDKQLAAIGGDPDKEAAPLLAELAWWKAWYVINPFKWLEGITGFVYLTLDQLCLRGNILSADDKPQNQGQFDFLHWRTWLRFAFIATFGLLYAVVRCIASPINEIWRPLKASVIKLFTNPDSRTMIIATLVLFTTVFIAISIFSGGTLPAALGFLAFANVAASGLAAWLGATTVGAIIAVNTILTFGIFVAASRLYQSIVNGVAESGIYPKH